MIYDFFKTFLDNEIITRAKRKQILKRLRKIQSDIKRTASIIAKEIWPSTKHFTEKEILIYKAKKNRKFNIQVLTKIPNSAVKKTRLTISTEGTTGYQLLLNKCGLNHVKPI